MQQIEYKTLTLTHGTLLGLCMDFFLHKLKNIII